MSHDLDIRVLGAGGQDQIRVLGETSNHPELPPSSFNFPAGHVTWGQPANGRVQVSLNQATYDQIIEHARSGVHGLNRVEVGGILLGRAFRSPDGATYHVAVEQALPDRLGISRAATFEFTHASWAALAIEAEEKHANLRIVGWYHSHPGYQAFFSPPDRHTQITYFSTPWRVGLVVDTIRDEGTFFVVAANNEEVVELPGFYERLGKSDRSVITWRNWPKPRHATELQASSVPPSRARLLTWEKFAKGIAIVWAILVSLLLLLSALELMQMKKELDDLHRIIQELTARGATITPIPTEPLPAPSRQPIPAINLTPPNKGRPTTPFPNRIDMPGPTPSPTHLAPANAIRTPAPPIIYTVRPGETLNDIAARFGTTEADLRRLNNLRTSTIHAWQQLLLPAP